MKLNELYNLNEVCPLCNGLFCKQNYNSSKRIYCQTLEEFSNPESFHFEYVELSSYEELWFTYKGCSFKHFKSKVSSPLDDTIAIYLKDVNDTNSIYRRYDLDSPILMI